MRRSAAAEAAPLWREVLERVLARLEPQGPRREREQVERAVEQALASMQRLEEIERSDPHHLGLLDEALERLARACEAARRLNDGGAILRRLEQVVDAVHRARGATLDEVVREQSAAPRARAREAPVRSAFLASVGVPHMFRLEREFVKPRRIDSDDVDLDEAWSVLEREAEDADRSGGEALDDAAVVPGDHASSWSAHVLRRLVRDALEDIGAMGLLRRARGRSLRHEAIKRFEQRMLDNLDALMSLAQPAADERDTIDVVHEARRYGEDAFTYDPTRAFARSFLLGCIEGADPVRAALGALRRSTPYTRPAEIEALALSPNPEVGEGMRRLSADDDPALVLAALEVLRFRGECDFGTAVILLSHPNGAVRAAAARCLALCEERAASRDALEAALDEEEDPAHGVAIAEALLVLDAPVGLAYVRKRLADARHAARPEPTERACLRLLSLAGGPRDADLLASWASDSPSWVHAVGWFGAASLLAPLVERAGSITSYRARTTARALERITGETLVDQVGGSAHLLVRDFRTFWAERMDQYPTDQRLRFGRPYDAHASIGELERDGSTGDERERCAFELAMASGGRARIEPHDWVLRQAEQAARARLMLADDRVRTWHRPGEWLAERLGKRR